MGIISTDTLQTESPHFNSFRQKLKITLTVSGMAWQIGSIVCKIYSKINHIVRRGKSNMYGHRKEVVQ
ncbi:hypothetical protein B7P43_G17950 [Cryptotermes secundus]|uniref:Uncharacterized protein n=1 Tax=Cryptotermes secundus TaxID=105785 RepID=A0A2J7R949_9NEOP|nr:hypothetical protein B7P43_G17950 [Cryptotermes secundus]